MTDDQMNRFKGSLRYLVKQFDGFGKDGSTCCGITQSQWDVLVEIGAAGEFSLVDLAKSLNLDTSTLSRTVNGMVMVGLLERIQSVTDRRFVMIKLSGNGKKLLTQINMLYENHLAAILASIPQERHELVVEVLKELADATQKTSTDMNCDCCL